MKILDIQRRYNEFWKENRNERIKIYSNIKFNNEETNDEECFFFEYVELESIQP